MNILKTLFGWIPGLFKKVATITDVILPAAIAATNVLKSIVDSPVSDIVTALTKTPIDNAVQAKLKKALPQVLEKLALAQKFLHLNDTEQILQAVIKELYHANDDEWSHFFTEFSGMLTYYMADGKMDIWESIAAAGAVYRKLNQK